MIIKYFGRIILIIPFLLMGYGCIFPMMWGKPGYGISIDVPIIHKDTIDSVRNALIAEGFELKAEEDFNWKRDISFRKYIATASKQVDHPYINLTLSYEKGQTPEQMKSFSIGMGNEWEGQQPQMKQEIDKTADILIAVLRRFVGEEDIKVERKATGPPF